jgi:hypothetical protein
MTFMVENRRCGDLIELPQNNSRPESNDIQNLVNDFGGCQRDALDADLFGYVSFPIVIEQRLSLFLTCAQTFLDHIKFIIISSVQPSAASIIDPFDIRFQESLIIYGPTSFVYVSSKLSRSRPHLKHYSM